MQTGDSFRLVVRRGPQPNQVFELKDDVLSLGRDITNSLVINDREVSRHHLRFTRGADGITLEDLGSTNGTFINGKRLTGAVLLKNGDIVGLGETVTLGYEVVRPGGMPAPSAPPAAQTVAPASPYAPPAQPAAAPYQPPSAQANPYAPPPQPAASGYTPPQASYTTPADSYGQGAPSGYDAQGYYNQPQGYGAPPPPGYDYDPYSMRETGGNNNMRNILFGCLGLLLFCCCITIVAVVLVDTLNLYCQIPVINQILEALGLIRCVVAGG